MTLKAYSRRNKLMNWTLAKFKTFEKEAVKKAKRTNCNCVKYLRIEIQWRIYSKNTNKEFSKQPNCKTGKKMKEWGKEKEWKRQRKRRRR